MCVAMILLLERLFFSLLQGGLADVYAADKEAYCEEAAAWLDTIQRVHQWESLRGVFVI